MRRFAFVLATTTLLLTGAGCLGRTGVTDDDIEADEIAGDAGEDTIAIIEAGPDSTPVVDSTVDTGRRDGWIDIFDVIPIPAEGGGVIGDCARCMRDTCGDAVNACINSPTCRAGLACVLTTCVTAGGGGPGGFDFACITKCFKGDFASAGAAISAFTCVIGKCGASCGAILGGLTGGGGGTDAAPPPKPDAGGGPKEAGSGSGGGTPGGGLPAGDKAEFKPWTEAEVRAIDPATRFEFSMEAFSPWMNEIHESACEQKLLVCK